MLEIGCGSGLLSLTAARMGARVTACDINNSAVNCTLENAQCNNQLVDVDTSDGFDNVPQQPFDCIIVNPPFYGAQPTDDASFAWYCGPTFDFFHRFFKDLSHYTHTNSRVWVILADTCDVEGIHRVAKLYGCSLEKSYERKRFMEASKVYFVGSRKQKVT